MKHFASIDAIRKASLDEIASLKGMTRKAAETATAAARVGMVERPRTV